MCDDADDTDNMDSPLIELEWAQIIQIDLKEWLRISDA
jgi:hypothetical protein